MTQENKELLFQDLCSRLPYGVKVCIELPNYQEKIFEEQVGDLKELTRYDEYLVNSKGIDYRSFNLNIKPYLFPLSSMTEEQYESLKESGILSNCSHSFEYVNPHIHGVSFIFKEFKTYSLELIEWLNKNHFDYRGLIPMGLAIDCTNLNIY